MERALAAVCFIAVAISSTINGSAAMNHHIVGGDAAGWNIPPNETFYQDWTKDRKFLLGDNLVFIFSTGAHSLIEVSQKDFEDCTQDNVVDAYYNGPLVLPLEKPGMHYYYCGVGLHCELGQKFSVNVTTQG